MREGVNYMNLENIDKLKRQIREFIDSGRIEEGKILAQDYLNVFPDDPDGYLMFGETLALQQQYDEAIEVLEKGVIKDGKNADIHVGLGVLHKKVGNYIDSFIHLYQAIKNSDNLELKKFAEEQLGEVSSFLSEAERKNLVDALENIRKVLFIQDIPCIRTKKVARTLAAKGIQTDIIYVSVHPSRVYNDNDMPYKNIYRLEEVNQTINFVRESDYDIIYSSNEPDYFTVLFLAAKKPIIHDTHDMMSLRGKLTNEQLVHEYIANVMSTGNIYTHEFVKEIALKKFQITSKPVLVIENFIERSMIPKQRKRKLSSIDGQIHCVFEGGLSHIPGHHRFLENHFMKIAEAGVHVHIYGHVDQEYVNSLQKRSQYIHYEGMLSPKELLIELTKYDIGLALFNVGDYNKTFLNSASPNKVFDYLAAGLPIAFADLDSFKLFNNKYKVGKIVHFDKPLYDQLFEIMKITIDESFLKVNKLTFNDHVYDILVFLNVVKSRHNSCYGEFMNHRRSEKGP